MRDVLTIRWLSYTSFLQWRLLKRPQALLPQYSFETPACGSRVMPSVLETYQAADPRHLRLLLCQPLTDKTAALLGTDALRFLF